MATLALHVVVSLVDDVVEEHGIFRNRDLAEMRARLLGREFGVIETAITAFPDQASVFVAYEFDRLRGSYTWAGLRSTPEAAKIVAGLGGHVIERKLEA